MFEFLFKFSPVIYQNGLFSARNLPQFTSAISLFLAMSLLVVLFAYRKTQAPLPATLKTSLLILRYLVIFILGFVLIEPVITLTTAVPRKSSLLLLVDASKSMQIADAQNDESRTKRVIDYLQGKENLLGRLQQNFNLHTYAFSDKIVNIDSVENLQNDGTGTDFSQALAFASAHSKSQPLAAVILISDGSNEPLSSAEVEQQPEDPFTLASMLGKQKIPLFTVGVGSKIEDDVRLVSITARPSLSGDGKTNISAYIENKGSGNSSVNIQIWENDILLKTEKVALSNKFTRYHSTLETMGNGYHHFTAKVIPGKTEIITANNSHSFLVDNSDRKGHVLYIEELHPWEFKFLKRALDHDRHIHFTSMVKTGKNYYRQGIRSGKELDGGFPSTKSELFKYDALIIGSIHSSAFTAQQLSLIKEFVSIRGGGLVMLGGPRAFTQGNWQKSALAEILPVELAEAEIAQIRSRQAIYTTPFYLALTPAGYRSPILEFSTDFKENKNQWDTLPSLLGFHFVGAAKPGATVLATHPNSRDTNKNIIIAWQNYGRGRTMVLATSSFWRWQMQLPSTDTRHEQFWRQIARWAALKTPAPINLELDKNTYAVNETVKLYVTVLDSQFQAITGAQLAVQIKQPVSQSNQFQAQGDPLIGKIKTIEAVADLQKPGRYIAEYLPGSAGFYQIEILAHTNSGKYLGHAETAFLAVQQNREFFDPALHENFLRRLATLSHGQYSAIDEAKDLAEKITVTESVYSKIVEHELWDAPIFFFTLILLLSIEWSVRRAKGLS